MSAAVNSRTEVALGADLSDLTGRLLTAPSVEDALARTLEGIAEYVPCSELAAAWNVRGNTGAVVLAARALSEDEARCLADQAAQASREQEDAWIGPPEFVRAVRVRPRRERSGPLNWTRRRCVCLAPNSVVGFLVRGPGADPAEAFDQSDVVVLLHCAAACLCRLCIEASGDAGARGGELQPRDGLSERLRRLCLEAADRGHDLAVMLVEATGRSEEMTQEATRAVGRLLLSTMRNSDLIFPAGPRRFCVLMPRTNPRHALIAAARLNSRLDDVRPPEIPAGLRLAVGVSGLDESSASAEQLYERAEAALAEARSPNGPGVFLYM